MIGECTVGRVNVECGRGRNDLVEAVRSGVLGLILTVMAELQIYHVNKKKCFIDGHGVAMDNGAAQWFI